MKQKPQKNTSPDAPQAPVKALQKRFETRGRPLGSGLKPTKQIRFELVLLEQLEAHGLNARAWLEQQARLKIARLEQIKKDIKAVSHVSDN